MLRHIYYTIQTLIRGRSSNVIKIISLTLGLFVGLLLFARVAFELSYDHFYPESRNLFLIQASYSYEGKQEKPSPYIYGAMPAAIRENFPDEVEEATVLRNVGQQIFFKGNERFDQQQTIYADDHFLPTMGVEVLKGNKADLVAPDAIFINESLARRVFGDADPIGQTMLWEKNYPVTVRGVFADQPENTDLKYDVIVSFATLYKRMGEDRAGWGYDISYMGVVRFHNDTEAPKRVAGRLPEMQKSIFRRGRMVFLRSILFNLYLSTTVVSRM
ncbi:ABC transporter permease [Bacteroides fragilis]|uniref:ABC transporter permease n=1 Tax=Bacteroides hominis TaxID=2763023 RepID=UPI00227A593F|nr:ABC transporter permease [Bacteroides fragilis]MCY6337708.1 ABC transporter permease [Bacteroides fragilis]